MEMNHDALAVKETWVVYDNRRGPIACGETNKEAWSFVHWKSINIKAQHIKRRYGEKSPVYEQILWEAWDIELLIKFVAEKRAQGWACCEVKLRDDAICEDKHGAHSGVREVWVVWNEAGDPISCGETEYEAWEVACWLHDYRELESPGSYSELQIKRFSMERKKRGWVARMVQQILRKQ